MTATKISLDNAKPEKLFYFVATVVVYRESDGRCLILKRDPREKVHPGKWGIPGGKLEWNDLDVSHPTRVNNGVLDYVGALEDLLKREAKEEAGVEIGGEFAYITSVAFVRPDETPVMMVEMAAKYLSGEVVLERGGFTDYAWVNAEEIKQYDCIGSIHDEVARAIQIFDQPVRA